MGCPTRARVAAACALFTATAAQAGVPKDLPYPTGELNADQIVEQLGSISGLEVTESTVYPVLARLSRDGCVTMRTVPSPSGPARRYYRLSKVGRTRLAAMIRHWQSIQDSVNQLIQGAIS